MNLEIKNLIDITKDNKFVQSFINELSKYLVKEANRKEHDKLQENGLYQVVDRSLHGVYLQDMKTNKVFEETNMPKEILEVIGNDYILRYKDGKYAIEEELTDKFFNGLLDIEENE